MDEERKAEIREIWKQEKMRSWLSFFFVLTVVIRNRPLILLACVLWIAYLAYCIRSSGEKSAKIANGVVMLLPIGFFLLNLIRLIKG